MRAKSLLLTTARVGIMWTATEAAYAVDLDPEIDDRDEFTVVERHHGSLDPRTGLLERMTGWEMLKRYRFDQLQ